jgi:GTPase SAR1 family protein
LSFRCFRCLLDVLLLVTLKEQMRNPVTVVGVCRIIACILHNHKLTDVCFNLEPSACVHNDAWLREGLTVPPDEVVRQGWKAVLQFLRAGAKVTVHELRLMLIGDGEAGKTSLQRAFLAPGHKAEWIGKEERTIGIDIHELLFNSSGKPTIKCQVCDFAGQAMYYFSHTMHFTRRCLYVLTWTTHKFSKSGAMQELTSDDILLPLKRWLQLLTSNVPEAFVLLVGTHCRVEPKKFDAMRITVEKQVVAEMERLRCISGTESTATREVLNRQQTKGQALLDQITVELFKIGQLQLAAPLLQLADAQKFVKLLHEMRPAPKRSLKLKAKLFLQTMQELTRTQERLCRLHGVYDGSVHEASIPVACLKLVNERSFAVDSMEGVGVAELLEAIEATCRDTQALPFMGEAVPKSWLQVADAIHRHRHERQQLSQQQQQIPNGIDDCVIKLKEAVHKVCDLLQTRPNVDVELAKCLDDGGIESCLEFWSLLGRMFVHDGHFLPESRLVIDLLKPLVHPDVLSQSLHRDGFRQHCLAKPNDFCSDSLLMQLHNEAVLDHRLLPHLAAWASSSTAARACMLNFFESTFMVVPMRSAAVSSGGSIDAQRSLVTARLFDCNDGVRQRQVDTLADDIAEGGIFHALYALPLAHVGIIAHMMAIVQALQPDKRNLIVTFARNRVCIQRGLSCCAVSVKLLSDVFASKLGSIQNKLPPGRFSYALVISSNNDGLFAFAARCVDVIMQSGSFGSQYQCWLPYRSSAADGNWRPSNEDWAELSSAENLKSLSEMLMANASDVVIPSMNLKLRDVLPRKPRIFMSHTYSGDGTGECCQRIKDGLQEWLLCTVWFDKTEMGWGTTAFIDEMKRGMANASVFVICLSPLYLTRPNCLRELMWAMDMCAADKSKKLCVLPMHPSVSHAGCKAILKLAAAGCAAQVILPVDDRCTEAPSLVRQLRGHKLSDVAVELLQRLIGPENVNIVPDWLKLQPWRSDAEGENWEETSQPWAGPCEDKSVELSQLLKDICVDIQAAVQTACPAEDLSVFTNLKDHELQSQPPSQEYQAPPDTTLLSSTFSQLLKKFPEADAVQLMLLGLRDADVVDCINHGLKRMSASSPMQRNPVDEVSRMAADMSGCFSSHVLAASFMATGSLSGSLKRQREIELFDDDAALADLPAKLKSDGVFALEDLLGLSTEEFQVEVSTLNEELRPLSSPFATVINSTSSLAATFPAAVLSQSFPSIETILRLPQADAADPSSADVAAHAELVRMFYSARMVPTNEYPKLAKVLIYEGIADESDLRISLSDDPGLLSSLGMKAGQRSCLIQYLNGLFGAAMANADPEVIALQRLKSFLEAAGVVPSMHHDEIAQRLIQNGVSDETGLRESLQSSSPAFDLRSVVVKPAQTLKITQHLEKCPSLD